MRYILLLCLLSSPAISGPWLRTVGDQFLSASVEFDPDNSQSGTYSSLYYELGFSDRWTLGIDAGADSLGFNSALVFARTSIWKGPKGGRAAVELGLGGAQDTTGTLGNSFAVKPGISWGHDIGFHQGGWVAVDATYGYREKDGHGLAKIEGTLGLNQGQRAKFLLQLTAEKPSDLSTTYSVTPGIAYRIGDAFHLVAGAVANDTQPTVLKIGFWQDF